MLFKKNHQFKRPRTNQNPSDVHGTQNRLAKGHVELARLLKGLGGEKQPHSISSVGHLLCHCVLLCPVLSSLFTAFVHQMHLLAQSNPNCIAGSWKVTVKGFTKTHHTSSSEHFSPPSLLVPRCYA